MNGGVPGSKFQSLIGSLSTHAGVFHPRRGNMFQSLIGSLSTCDIHVGRANFEAQFQSLIGSLSTL